VREGLGPKWLVPLQLLLLTLQSFLFPLLPNLTHVLEESVSLDLLLVELLGDLVDFGLEGEFLLLLLD